VLLVELALATNAQLLPSPPWNILHNSYEELKANYDESYERQYGFFRSVVDDVVHDYLKCGDLKEGFARVGQVAIGGVAGDWAGHRLTV
jgi:hypothetical protein